MSTRDSDEHADGRTVWTHIGPNNDIGATVAEAVADAKGLDVTELDCQLYETIDTSALETMYQHATHHGDADWSVTFTVDGLTVDVGAEGVVTVT